MNELAAPNRQLPDTLPDLAAFVLVGREKLTAVRAEIRAIDRVQLAKDVRQQKQDEARMLSEALLDAEKRIGELTKAIPKGSGGDRRSDNFKNDSTVGFEKSKTEVITDLGFTPKQVERFEILADNPDVVEQVKQEARENDDIPTRTRVIDIVQQRKKEQSDKTAASSTLYKQFHNALFGILTLDISKANNIADWIDDCKGIPVSDYISDIGRTIEKLENLRAAFMNYERRKSNG